MDLPYDPYRWQTLLGDWAAAMTSKSWERIVRASTSVCRALEQERQAEAAKRN